ncbi:hypothetical protein WICPIJ_006665, partial [Wickerhamomyces pijperi]
IVADEIREPRERPARNTNSRGGNRAPKGKGAKPAPRKVALNDKNFPAL